MEKLRIGILGVGAIGSVLSFKINDQHETYYYNRSNKSKIVVQDEKRVKKKEITLSNSKESTKLDWLLICLKEYHFIGAEKDLKCLIDTNTKIAVIRNGIDLKKPILKYTSEEKIIECMIDCPTQITKEGYYHQLRKPVITTGKNELSSEFPTIFTTDGIEIRQVEDYLTENWKKLIESSALGGILALSGEPCWIFEDQELVKLYEEIVKEGILIAQAEGAKIDASFKNEIIDKLKKYPASKESSMLIDRRNGNQIEINAKNGVISNLGKKHQIETKLNDSISILLKYTNSKK
jgi:2-dehydropantoate 2-reductase